MIPLLEVRGLCIGFRQGRRDVRVVEDLALSLGAGKTVAIVGESGAGKTLTVLALLGLLPRTARLSGSVRLLGKELVGLAERELRRHRGRDLALIPQDPGRALNPTMSIGPQIAEAVRVHGHAGRREAKHRAVQLLEQLGLAGDSSYGALPHELAGGMRQRAMIAVALAAEPKIVIADESTSALDAITRATVMHVLEARQQRLGTGLVLITHDLALAANRADDALVLQAGRTIARGPEALSERARAARMPPRPEPAKRLRGSALGGDGTEPPVLEARRLRQAFEDRAGGRAAFGLRDISFTLYARETLGVIGESGAGKSTLARTLLLAPRPVSGTVLLRGTDLMRLHRRRLRERRAELQIVFQNPVSSLDPRWRVESSVAEPLVALRRVGRRERLRRAHEALERVGLPPGRYARRRPHELSGGQCQRVAVARALTLAPAVIVCDEAVASLDASAKMRLLDLFRELRDARGLAYIFISHDLEAVRTLSDRVAVLHEGRLCELGPVDEVFSRPRHPYTASLVGCTGLAITSRRPAAARTRS